MWNARDISVSSLGKAESQPVLTGKSKGTERAPRGVGTEAAVRAKGVVRSGGKEIGFVPIINNIANNR